MSKNITLSNLTARVRSTADHVSSSFVSDSEIYNFINDSATDLYDQLISNVDDDYYLSNEETSLSNGTSTYSLPTDFFKLRGVDYVQGGDRYTMSRYGFDQRNSLDGASGAGWGIYQYRIQGSNVSIIPEPGTGTIDVHYYPTMSRMTGSADTIDVLNGLDQYLVVDAAMRILEKEDRSTVTLQKRKDEMLRRITSVTKDRDVGQPPRVVDPRRRRRFKRSV